MNLSMNSIYNKDFFNYNGLRYTLPNIVISNSRKFELFEEIIFGYNYIEFQQNFDEIYRTSDHEHQVICYYVVQIIIAYKRRKIRLDQDIDEIVKQMQNLITNIVGRKNSKHFNSGFIAMICCWAHYKNVNDEWIPSYNQHLRLNEKIDRFLLPFGL